MRQYPILFFSFLLLLFILSPSVSALNPKFNCPAEVLVNEDFKCSLKVSEFSENLDVKVELKNSEKTVAKIWDPEKEDWKSAYYYLKDYVTDSEDYLITLKIESAGEYNGLLKLRSKNTKSFEFKITAEEKESEKEPDKSPKESEEEKVVTSSSRNSLKNEPSLKKQSETIHLNTEQVLIESEKSPSTNKVSRELVYQSKSSRSLEYAPYAFSLFLIIILAVLLFQKF